jgi:hypothetical protein
MSNNSRDDTGRQLSILHGASGMIKRLCVYIVLMTWIFAQMDWRPIHHSYLRYGDWPDHSVYAWWGTWSTFRHWTALILCPPCAALAEHYYFVFFEIEAGQAEQHDLLLKHLPDGAAYEGVLSRSGFWWGQGGEDNSNPWKRVSLWAWYLYWLPYTVMWWCLYARDLFAWQMPGWMLWIWKRLKRRVEHDDAG